MTQRQLQDKKHAKGKWIVAASAQCNSRTGCLCPRAFPAQAAQLQLVHPSRTSFVELRLTLAPSEQLHTEMHGHNNDKQAKRNMRQKTNKAKHILTQRNKADQHAPAKIKGQMQQQKSPQLLPWCSLLPCLPQSPESNHNKTHTETPARQSTTAQNKQTQTQTKTNPNKDKPKQRQTQHNTHNKTPTHPPNHPQQHS
jgi:hypothetical protein